MTIRQRFLLNKAIYTHTLNTSDKELLGYYKSYIKIFNNWAYIVDNMNTSTLSSAFKYMKKSHAKNVIRYLQIYCKYDTMFLVRISVTYGTDVLKLLLEY